MDNVWRFFQAGGWVMWPLLGLSLAGVATTVYCFFAMRRENVIAPVLARIAENLDREDDVPAALKHCREEGGPFAEVLLVAIEHRAAPREECETLVEAAGRRATHELSRPTLVLDVVASVGPLLGLLGTVSGMYNLMMKMAQVGANEIGAIAGGIGEALITTLTGLVIAIPAYVAYTWAGRRVDALTLSMEEYAINLMTRWRAHEQRHEQRPESVEN